MFRGGGLRWRDYTEGAPILFTSYPNCPGSLVVMPRWYYLSITLFQKEGCPQREMPVYSGTVDGLVPASAKACKFNQAPLVYFCFYLPYSWRWAIYVLSYVYPMFSCKSFIVSGLMFGLLIHFQFILFMVLGGVLMSLF